MSHICVSSKLINFNFRHTFSTIFSIQLFLTTKKKKKFLNHSFFHIPETATLLIILPYLITTLL
uniref:Uncharacterized protein n=1 Tax=Octopus bimaculoides TaxID=37653 RepID=A0A0L8H448_OCTBM